MKALDPPVIDVEPAGRGVSTAQLHSTKFVTVPPLLLAPSRNAGYNSPVATVSQIIRVKVLFFGRLKEIVGRMEDSIEFSILP